MKHSMHILGLLAVMTVCADAAFSQPRGIPPASWSPELAEAFELYYAGGYPVAQRLATQIASATRDARLQRDAAALAALAIIRQPGRDNQRDGKARLLQLAGEDPRLLNRPECRFALGIADLAIHATASALREFESAARAFAERGQTVHLAECYVALAQTWSRHSEWEIRIPEINVDRPDNPAQANRIRVEQIRVQRTRAEELPAAEDAVDRIDLILASLLLDADGESEEAGQILARLAQRDPLTEAAAQAAVLLAERHEAASNWNEALSLYERIEATKFDDLAEQASGKLNEIRTPQLKLEVPAQAIPGQAVRVKLSARNLAHVSYEVRRVDLVAWLEQRQGQFVEAALPITGTTIALCDLSVNTLRAHDWWHSDEAAAPLTFEAPVGAFVVVARASDAHGHALAVKRLLICGRLELDAFYGDRHMALWVRTTAAGERPAPMPSFDVHFWMHGSFVPQRWTMNGSAGIFELPADARVFRDKRWIVVIRAGEELAVCRGMLSDSGKDGSVTAVLLSGGPSEVRVGADMHVAGRLLHPQPARLTERKVELSLVDASDQNVYLVELELTAAGTFSARIPVSEAMAGKTLRAAVRHAGRIPTIVYAPVYFRVLPLDQPNYAVRFEIQRTWRTASTEIPISLAAAYPWGTPLAEAHANLTVQPFVMPVPLLNQPAFSPVCRIGHLHTDSLGSAVLNYDLAADRLPEGPLALGFWAECRGWDDRASSTYAEAIAAADPVHLWFETEGEPLQVDAPIRFMVHWFDPTGLTVGRLPSLTIRHPGAVTEELELAPILHYARSAIWRPRAGGRYEILVRLKSEDNREFTAAGAVEIVSPPDTSSPDAGPLRLEARRAARDARDGVNVCLDGRSGPLLLIVQRAGDPLGVYEIERVSEAFRVFIPLRGAADGELDVLAFQSGASKEAPVPAARCTVIPERDRELSIVFPQEQQRVKPGEQLMPNITCMRGSASLAEGVLVARLTDVSRSGGVQWIPGQSRTDATFLPWQMSHIDFRSNGDPVPQPAPIPETRELSALQNAAWFAGRTRSISVEPIQEGRATPTITMPAEPGYYRLVLSVETPTCEFALQTVDFDLREGVFMEAFVPEELYLGDRVDVFVRVANASSEPRVLNFSHSDPPQLHHEPWRIIPASTGRSAPRWDQTRQLMLEPHQTVILVARAEAAQVGVCGGSLLYSLKSEDEEWTASPNCSVFSDVRSNSEQSSPAVAVQRRLYRLRKGLPIGGEDELETFGKPMDEALKWLREELEPSERLRPGEMILVSESVSTDVPLENISWEQPLPANCHTHRDEWSQFPRVGMRAALSLQSVRYESRRLDPHAALLHEYVIVPVRSGACRFPAPRVRAADGAVWVELSADAEHVVVVESD